MSKRGHPKSPSSSPKRSKPDPESTGSVSVGEAGQEVAKLRKFEETFKTIQKKYSEKIIYEMKVDHGVLKIPKKNDPESKLERFVSEFLSKVCCLRNSKGGILVIHVMNRPSECISLDDFDEKLIDYLREMTEDDTFYVDNYERRWFVKEGSRIVPESILLFVEKSSSISTYDFNTKVTLNGRRDRPKAREIAKMLSETKPDNTCDRSPTKITLQEDTPVNLYESSDIQFKRLDRKDLEKDYTLQSIADHLRLKLHLHEYITTFTKLKGGGSFFTGIEEEKKHVEKSKTRSQPKGKQKSETTKKGPEPSKQKDLSSKQMEETPSEQHEEKKTLTCVKTGQNIVKGFSFEEAELKDLKDLIEYDIVKYMLWLSKEGEEVAKERILNSINIEFHPTTNNQQDKKYVIEILVKRRFDGVVFYDKEGPKSFVAKGTDQERIDARKWIRLLKKAMKCATCKRENNGDNSSHDRPH